MTLIVNVCFWGVYIYDNPSVIRFLVSNIFFDVDRVVFIKSEIIDRSTTLLIDIYGWIAMFLSFHIFNSLSHMPFNASLDIRDVCIIIGFQHPFILYL